MEPQTPAGNAQQIVIHNVLPKPPGLWRWFVRMAIVFSILLNIGLMLQMNSFASGVSVAEKFKDGDSNAPDKIAIISVNGLITSETIQAPKRELKHALEDNAVKAVVLSIDSPGGTIAGSDELFHAVEEFREKSERKKPIVASMRGMAASGGYYVAMPADRIFAERSCITGSIGVISSMFQVSGLMEKLGVVNEVIKSGKMKDSGSPFRSMTDDERKEWNKLILGMYEQFLGVILKYRKDAIGGEEKLRAIADGRVYLAEEALKLKLIDAIGYQDDAIAEAKKMAQLPDKVRVVTYVRPYEGIFDLFFGRTPVNPASKLDANFLLQLQTPQFLYMLGPAVGAVH